MHPDLRVSPMVHGPPTTRGPILLLDGKGADVLPQLLRAGGSPGGARPKVLVGVRGDSGR